MFTLSNIYKKLPPVLLLVHLILGLLFCMYVAWMTDSLGGDTLEHMHVSWLVYAKFIPYKDFFQHHNPLLWYMFAPVLGLYTKGVSINLITSTVISAAILASFINYLYLYLITSRFLTTKFGGVVAAAIAFTPYIVLSVIHFRPDNFMMTSFFAGLYYYFCYIEKKRLGTLCLSFILFWCSFMFLQKIVFTLLLVGFITIYLIYKKIMKLSDVLYAAMLPAVLSIGFAAYLYHHDILDIWYKSNFTFNLHIPELFDDNRRLGVIWIELKCLLLGSTLAIIFCSKRSNIYFKILVIIFCVEAVQRLFYFSAFAYYFYLLVYTASILTAYFLTDKIFAKWWWLTYVLAVALGISMYKPEIYNGNIGNRVNRFYHPLHEQITKKINPCDYVLNGDGSIYNIFNRDPHYYWNLLGQLDVIGAKVGIRPLMNINRVIEVYKPKIIFGKIYYDKYAKEHGQDVIVHEPDMELIEKYYKPMESPEGLYILKPEFAPAKCEYDYKKRYYHAYD